MTTIIQREVGVMTLARFVVVVLLVRAAQTASDRAGADGHGW